MGLHSSRQVGGTFLALAGLAMLASAALLNPWAGAWMGGAALDRADVLGSYFWSALGLGFLNLLLGASVAAAAGAGRDGIALGLFVLSLVILADRLLLVVFGLPLWVHDPVLHYRNRPEKVLRWNESGASAVVRINRWGHHDDDFSLAKPPGELRGLMLGDSITMGHGVTRDETFANRLEALLRERDRGHTSHQVINTGVHGYSAYQELRVLHESLAFDPDFVALGFCMNDVTEPFVKDRELGGVGFDYHGVLQTPHVLLGHLFNETGFGRLVQKTRARSKSREAEKLQEVYDVSRLARAPLADPTFREPWSRVLGDLEAVYDVVRAERLPFVLLVFPFAFQLLDEEARAPQRILVEHATRHGVAVIDFTDLFRELVYRDEGVLRTLREERYPQHEIEAFFAWRLREYYLDADHFTAAGHAVIAERLFQHLAETGVISPDGSGAPVVSTIR